MRSETEESLRFEYCQARKQRDSRRAKLPRHIHRRPRAHGNAECLSHRSRKMPRQLPWNLHTLNLLSDAVSFDAGNAKQPKLLRTSPEEFAELGVRDGCTPSESGLPRFLSSGTHAASYCPGKCSRLCSGARDGTIWCVPQLFPATRR